MSERKEKSAPEMAVSGAEKERIHRLNIAQSDEKSKLVLTKSQCKAITDIYKSSQSAFELVDRLSGLKFCDLTTAATVLVANDFITEEDKEYMLGINIEIRRRK